MKKHKLVSKMLSMLLCLCMLLQYAPAAALTVSAAPGDVAVSLDFNDGTNGGFVRSHGDGTYIVFDATTANYQETYASLSLSSNTEYEVRFSAKANKETTLRFVINNNWGNDTVSETVNVTTEWQDFQLVVNSGELTNSIVKFCSDAVAGEAATYCIDDLVIAEYDPHTHSYDNACDADCNLCGETREVGEHEDQDGNGSCDHCGAAVESAEPDPEPVEGSVDNPQVITASGDYTATITEETKDGYFYLYTAPGAGEVTVTMLDENWRYCVDCLTCYEYGDMYWSDDSTVVESTTIEVEAGCEIRIMVSTYDPNYLWDTPLGDLNWNLSFTCTDHAYDNACDADCNLCGETREGTGHQYDDCYDRECNICSETREGTGHMLTYHEGKTPANCQETGYDEYWTCDVCEEYFGDADASWQINPAWMYYHGDCVPPEGSAPCAGFTCTLCGEASWGGEPCDRGDAPACQDATCINCGEVMWGEGHSYGFDETTWESLIPLCQPGDCIYCGEHLDKIYDCENGSWAPCIEDGECVYGCGRQYPATGEHDLDDPCAGGLCWSCWENIDPVHTYDNVCDADCNNCGETREVGGHDFYRGKCNACGYECEHWYVNDQCASCGARKIPFSSSFGKGLTMENDVAFPGETFSTKITSVTGKLGNYAKVRIDEEDYYVGDSPVTYIDGILTIPGDLITGRVWLYFNAGIDITFHTNGGAFIEELEATGDSYTTDGDYSDKEYRYGDDFVRIEQLFVREGYELTGMNSKADGSGIAYDDDTMVTFTQDLDFYAQWRCLHAKGFATTDDGNFKCNTCGMTAPIVITAEPEDVAVPYNDTALSTVEALGEGLTYQWYYRDEGRTDFIKSIYTGDTYSLIMYKGRNNREVYCVITDANGNSATTRTATLAIDPQNKVQIVTQPTDISAAYNSKAVTTVEATGDGLTYQWYYKDDHHEDFQKSVYKTNEYSLIMYKGRDGRQVYCEITDAYGTTVTTNTVTLSIAPQDGIVITHQPADVSAAYNQKAVTTVVAEGEGLTYQWYYRDEGRTSFVKSQYTGDSYSLIMYKGRNNRQVYCEITDACGNTVATEIATLTIQPQNTVQIVTQPTDVSAAFNEKAIATVEATGDGLTYQWYYKDAHHEEFRKSIYTVDNYSLIMYGVRDGRQIRCVITDAYGNSVTTETVTLSISE